ncbi:MAG: vitamin K epoxide reductase family protein [Candidatus Paceibacterota bacterium]
MFFILEKVFFDLGPLVFGLCGFFLALYVYTKKQKQENLVCPMNGSCDEVVNSRYSKFFGIRVELLGMLYYAFIVLVYSFIFLNSASISAVFKFFVTGITVGAFLFSMYLVIIQAFVLRKWCTWCLFSAGFTTFIFVTAIFGADFSLTNLLAEYKGIIVFFHAFAAAIGVGAATITDIFFFKYLKDYKISESEHKTMETLSSVIWVALGVLVLTGIGLFIPQSEILSHSSKFLTKALAVLVLILNGVMLNLSISPRMMEITFGDDFSHQKGELHFMRKLAFALGAISITSWYTIFILGSIRSIPVSTGTGVFAYILLLFVAIIGSQVFDRLMIRKRKKELNNKN